MTVVLLAHGSPDPRHARDVASLAARLAGSGTPTRIAYLDHDEPSPLALAHDLTRQTVAGVPALPDPAPHGPRTPALPESALKARPAPTPPAPPPPDRAPPAPAPAPPDRTPLETAQSPVVAAHHPNGQSAPAPPLKATVVPLFVVPAYHARVDVPAAVRAIRDAAPHWQVALAEPAGLHPLVLEAAAELAIGSGRPIDPSTGILLAAAGSRNRGAVLAMDELVASHGDATARRLGARALGTAYLDGGPSIAQSVRQLASEGAETFLVVTLTVADGVLRDRLSAAAAGLGIPVAPGTLSDTAAFAELVLRRARDAVG